MSALPFSTAYLMFDKTLTTSYTLILCLRDIRLVHLCAACAYACVAKSQPVGDVHVRVMQVSRGRADGS